MHDGYITVRIDLNIYIQSLWISYSDSYDPGWSNQSNISWQAQAPENYAPQFHELYHQVEPSPRLDSDFQVHMLKFMSNME